MSKEIKLGMCDNCHESADKCHCGDYINTALPANWQRPHDAHVERKLSYEFFGE